MKIAVIGAGASGLMCAGFLAKKGHDVSVFDGNEKAGKKLYITGKGRCNFTNVSFDLDFQKNIVRGEKFLFSALNGFNSEDSVSFFEELGMKTKVERGNRAFPLSDKASDVTKALLKHCEDVKFAFNEKVETIYKKDHFIVTTSKGKYEFDSVVVATGGSSYKATGSTGDGYRIAKSFGHNIIEIKPALCAIELKDAFIKQLQGLSLKNVSLIVKTGKNKIEEFGEMLFTDKGISGPIVLSVSSFINRLEEVSLCIDFKPRLSKEVLNDRLLREFGEAKNKEIKNIMKNLLPSSLVDVFLGECNISASKKVNSVTQAERMHIIEKLKDFQLEFKGLYPLDSAIITSGGVDTKQINPKTMESKLVEGVYFIGEVLDIDALTGGYNLQLAFSTAVACARSFKEVR